MARAAFEVSGHIIADHFVDVTKMVHLERNSLFFQAQIHSQKK